MILRCHFLGLIGQFPNVIHFVVRAEGADAMNPIYLDYNATTPIVLLAMGVTRSRALGAVRFSLGRFTTATDVDRAADALATTWRTLTR
jgi:selenocysteine lyase/cysteine desulfurase